MLIGSHIARYVVLKLLGEGGMGSVYLVEHAELKTRHAIKVLLPHLSKHPQIVQRFRNEARAAAATRSPNIIAVRDFGQLDDGAWYLVMDYWDGTTLSGFMASRGPLPHGMIVRTAVDALNGLAAAHTRHIIHRDLKPDNLYLAEVDGDVRTMILDFGVCRLGEDAGGVVTRTGAVIGTPKYMCPEQFRGQPIDHRADLWAMGATIYEMATGGWLPYNDDGAPRGQILDDAILNARMSYPPVDPQRRAPWIPRALADAILMMIDPAPAKRPASAAACALLLAETLPGDGYEPSGIEMLQKRAPELLRGVDVRDTVRSPVPVMAAHGLPSRYAIRSRIGSGGMAEVFRADSLGAEGFARPVALKRVLAGFSEMPAFARMFCEEARLASHLSHPNCVAVLDFDRDAERRLFLVMEYVAGKDLGAVLQTGRLPPAMAIFVVSEILRGLEYAHALPNPSGGIRGLVHRDISPHNVLLSWEGAVKVSDFGIAKALGADSGTGNVKGKPAYMSPEQVNAEPLDGRSDLFSVGIVLWEALTGTRLFKGERAKETFGQILFRDAARPSTVRPGIPADLEAVVMKLLMRERNARYATAEQAIEDLARCNDNPRNGRSDLVRFLASRFPAEVEARSQGRTTSDRTEFPRNAQIAAATPQSTLGNAASQSLPRPPRHGNGRRWLRGAFATIIAAAASFAVVFVVVRGESRSEDPAITKAATAPDESAHSPANSAVPIAVAPPVPPDASASEPSLHGADMKSSAPVATAAHAEVTTPVVVAVHPDASASSTVVVAAHLDAGVPDPVTVAAHHEAATPSLAPAAAHRPASIAVTSSPDAGVTATRQVAAVTSTPPPVRALVEKGALSIYVVPFAQVWVDDASDSVGQTPLHLKLRVGSHRIRLANKRLNKEKTVPVAITTVKEAVIDETW